ncbi:DUF3696 domain-containing protein [Streptomyces sp. NPDC091219]|uniref:AAA family ATPase n=1 Tax=Streptomyces sp. NPDC091219 TaxID=3155193 RepID=UPI00344E0273
MPGLSESEKQASAHASIRLGNAPKERASKLLTEFRIRDFKAWVDSGIVKTPPLTVFFGRNSSGKSSLLQSLLTMKQTAESLDPKQVLDLGGPGSYVDLGSFKDIARGHSQSPISFEFAWKSEEKVALRRTGANELTSDSFRFNTTVGPHTRDGTLVVHEMAYTIEPKRSVGMKMTNRGEYTLTTSGISLTRRRGRAWPLPDPIKCYAFPDQGISYYSNADFLADLAFQFDELMSGISYVGPLREHPQRTYAWRGANPTSVGPKGEQTIEAILAARLDKRKIGRGSGRARRYQSFDENLGTWLQRLGLVEHFSLEEIAAGRKIYELNVVVNGGMVPVAITDVGFGVSQALPVLVQLYYAPSGSLILLEQPEIHLHPAVQSNLADVMIDAVRHNGVQIITESHSEHLLRRLQRRIAEGEIDETQVALYFVDNIDGEASIKLLRLDKFGNISNWPHDFFGDEVGDLVAMTEAAISRQDPSA